MPPIAFDCKLGTRCGINEFLNVANAAEFHDGERADHVHLIHLAYVLERRRDTGVFAQVIDDIGCFRNAFFDVSCVATPVLCSSNMILLMAVEIIVERDNFVAWIGTEDLNDVRPDVPCATSNHDGFSGHIGYFRCDLTMRMKRKTSS